MQLVYALGLHILALSLIQLDLLVIAEDLFLQLQKKFSIFVGPLLLRDSLIEKSNLIPLKVWELDVYSFALQALKRVHDEVYVLVLIVLLVVVHEIHLLKNGNILIEVALELHLFHDLVSDFYQILVHLYVEATLEDVLVVLNISNVVELFKL